MGCRGNGNSKGKGKGKGKGAEGNKGKGAGGKGGRDGVASQRAWTGGRDGNQAVGWNTKKVRSGKHSRWSRYLQTEFGSKAIAELIVFTGRVQVEYLQRRVAPHEAPVATLVAS